MNRTQIIGIGLIVIGIITYLLVESNIIQTISGILSAIGLGFILKWIPFEKQKINQ